MMTACLLLVSLSWLSPKPPGQLTLIQHGRTAWTSTGRHEGWADPDLSPEGVEQVGEAAQNLRKMGYEFNVAYTSVLKRAIRTTWIILQELDLSYVPVQRLWRLNERSLGSLTGMSTSEAVSAYSQDEVAMWLDGSAIPPPYENDHPFNPKGDRRYAAWQEPRPPWKLRQVPIPQSESYECLTNRCSPVWKEQLVPDLKAGKSVLVVAHAETLRAIMADMCNVDTSCMVSMVQPDPCAPLHFRFEWCGGALLPLLPSQPTSQSVEIASQSVEGGRQTEGKAAKAEGLLDAREEAEWAAAAAVAEDTQRKWWRRAVRESSWMGGRTVPASAAALPSERQWPSETCGEGFVSERLPVGKPSRRQEIVIIRHGKTFNNQLGIFTGWDDAPLAPEGRAEAAAAGALLRKHGYQFDIVYTSWLSRAIHTAWLVMSEMNCIWLPVHKSWRLNERMYGGLTGVSKRATKEQHGEEKFKAWRRGYDDRPPRTPTFSPFYPGNDPRYVENMHDIRISVSQTIMRSFDVGRLSIHRKMPRTESLKDCMERTIPYWTEIIQPEAIDEGKSVLIATSENAIRGLLMHLCGIPKERISEIEIPTGLPLIYELEERRLRLLEGDPADYNFGRGSDLLFNPPWTIKRLSAARSL